MEQRAGVIFAGEVAAIRRVDGINGSAGVVEIEFKVEDAVRGVAGSTYRLREWAGLWNAPTPFHLGQRCLLLLHTPSAAGLSSPVDGTDGCIPIRASSAPGLAQTRVATGPAVAEDTRTVDLRWIQARVQRPVAYASSPAKTTALPVPTRARVLAPSTSVELEPRSPSMDANLALSSNASYSSVIALLRLWERSDATR